MQTWQDIEGTLHSRQNAYRVNGAGPLAFNAAPGGTTVVNNLARVSMTPLRGGTSLFFTFTEKVTVNANGVVVRAFSASDFSCSR